MIVKVIMNGGRKCIYNEVKEMSQLKMRKILDCNEKRKKIYMKGRKCSIARIGK